MCVKAVDTHTTSLLHLDLQLMRSRIASRALTWHRCPPPQNTIVPMPCYTLQSRRGRGMATYFSRSDLTKKRWDMRIKPPGLRGISNIFPEWDGSWQSDRYWKPQGPTFRTDLTSPSLSMANLVVDATSRVLLRVFVSHSWQRPIFHQCSCWHRFGEPLRISSRHTVVCTHLVREAAWVAVVFGAFPHHGGFEPHGMCFNMFKGMVQGTDVWCLAS